MGKALPASSAARYRTQSCGASATQMPWRCEELCCSKTNCKIETLTIFKASEKVDGLSQRQKDAGGLAPLASSVFLLQSFALAGIFVQFFAHSKSSSHHKRSGSSRAPSFKASVAQNPHNKQRCQPVSLPTRSASSWICWQLKPRCRSSFELLELHSQNKLLDQIKQRAADDRTAFMLELAARCAVFTR